MRLTQRELSRLSEPPRHVPYKHGTLDAVELVERYQGGVSINRLAFENSTTEKRIRGILLDREVELRTQAQASR